MTIVHDSLERSGSLYSTCRDAPLRVAKWAAPRGEVSAKRRVFAWVSNLARRWHDARVRSARLHSLAMLDSRTLQDISYLHGDVSEVREILAARYRNRLLS